MKRRRTREQIRTIMPRPRVSSRMNRTRTTVYSKTDDYFEPGYIGGSRTLRLPTADEQARGMRDDED